MYYGFLFTGTALDPQSIIDNLPTLAATRLSAKSRTEVKDESATVIELTQFHERMACDYEITVKLESDNTVTVNAWGNIDHIGQEGMEAMLAEALPPEVLDRTSLRGYSMIDDSDEDELMPDMQPLIFQAEGWSGTLVRHPNP